MSSQALTFANDAAAAERWTYTPQVSDDMFFRWLDSHCGGINRLIVRLFG